MTSTASAPVANPQGEELERQWKQRINDARDYRRQLPFEPTWLSDLAFAAGQQYLVWVPQQGRMLDIRSVSKRYEGRELYTADRINEQRQAQLGELSSDDDRPELLVAQNGDTAEEQAKALNAAVAYGWEHEWTADEALEQARSFCLDMGTAAIRCRWDPTLGPVVVDVPHQNGKPQLDVELARQLMANGPRPDVTVKSIHEGRTVWEPLSAFNILSPPGVNHEQAFPWEIIVRPALLAKVQEQYPAAAGLQEDTDIASVIGLSTAHQPRSTTEQSTTRGRLRDHVWLFTCYERPTQKQPNGRVLVFATNQMKLLDVEQKLPYKAPDGTPRSGIAYFHWWRLNDRFWSRSFIQPMKDPQRLINRRETQNAEIIDRGMPKVITVEGTLIHDPKGLPMENIEIKEGKSPPQWQQGIGPGPWMYEDIAHHVDNLSHASALGIVAMGENPANVNTYAQLALLNENEAGKRSRILTQHKRSIAQLVEDSVFDIRTYWPAKKTILVSGDDDTIAQQVFEKNRVPDWFMVKVAKGAPMPRSQAAEITKIDAIWTAARTTGVVVASPEMAEKWTAWYAGSLNAGEALEIPKPDPDAQAEMAHFENELMLHQGQTPEPTEYDVVFTHEPIHREAQDQARAANDAEAYQRIQSHIDKSRQAATITKTAVIYADPQDITGAQAASMALDEDQALREISMLIHGIPLNPEALQQAQASLDKHINPETGQPVQVNPETGAVMDDLQGILMRASVQPQMSDNLQVKLDRIAKVIKADEFEGFQADVRARILAAFDATRKLWLSIPLMPTEATAPKITLSAREDLGPSTVAAILHRAGVTEADPQLIASEPPLANMVTEQLVPANTPAGTENKPAPAAPKPAAKPKGE